MELQLRPISHTSICRTLKDHLDKFVVGQRRAKRVLSTAVYYHYRRVQQVRQRQEEEEEYIRATRAMDSHPLEGTAVVRPRRCSYITRDNSDLALDEFPDQQSSVHYQNEYKREDFLPIHDHTPLTLEKSNVLCLGPTGVGKTLMIRWATTMRREAFMSLTLYK